MNTDATSANQTPSRFASLRKAPLLAMLIASAVVNVMLAHKVTSLRSVITYMRGERSLKIGAAVGNIEAKALDGTPAVVKYADTGAPTILYVFSPSCGWCSKNLENLRSIQRNVAGRYRLVGLSLSRTALKEYIDKEGLTFPVYTDVSQHSREEYRMGGTPQTIVVSSAGVVTHTWMGAFEGDQKAAVEKALSVHLPGILTASKL